MPKRKTLSRSVLRTQKVPQNPRVPPVSHTKRAGDGFYQYVNQAWIAKAHINSWRSEFGVSDEVENQTDKELLDLLGSVPEDSLLGRVTHVWNTRSVTREEEYLKVCLNELISPDMHTIARFIGWMSKARIPTVFTLVVQEEINPPYFARESLIPGDLTLPLSYYRNPDGLKDTELWAAYVDYITVCSLELGLPFLRAAIDAEQSIANALDAPFTDLTKTSRGDALHRWVPEFQWSGFMEGLTDDTWHSRVWLLDSPQRLKRVLHWICRANQEHVVAVFALHLITFAAPYLRPAIRDAASRLFNKALRGVTVDPPSSRRYLSDMKTILPDALCALYSEAQHDTAKRVHVEELLLNLKEAATDIIHETRILSKASRSNTVEKIRRMKFSIGSLVDHQTNLTDGKAELVYSESLLRTIVSIQSARSSKMRELAGKPSQPDADYPCFQANASYYSESNHIVMPWGILQWPYYHKDAPLGWNYGGIGATIAHEMTHGFDLEGVQYSPRAVYKTWWTRKNRETFSKRTRRVGAFFGKFKHYGLAINSGKTASEDWADFGGMTIALRGLKKVLDTQGANDHIRKEAYRNFFIAYAVSWRTLLKKEKMVYSLMTSVHAPAEDRVDRIVPQFQEWVDAFDIQKGDALYIPRAQRLKFF